MKKPRERDNTTPTIFTALIKHLRNTGLSDEGLFRISGSKDLQQELRARIDDGESPDKVLCADGVSKTFSTSFYFVI